MSDRFMVSLLNRLVTLSISEVQLFTFGHGSIKIFRNAELGAHATRRNLDDLDT
jgi:hypothetical protein